MAREKELKARESDNVDVLQNAMQGSASFRAKAEERGRDMAAFTRMVHRSQSLLACRSDAR